MLRRISARRWSSSSSSSLTRSGAHFDVVVVGAGSAGMAVLSQLVPRLDGRGRMALVEPNPWHYYQPLWTLVGGGVKAFEESRRPTQQVLRQLVPPPAPGESAPPVIDWLQQAAQSIAPDQNTVHLADGQQITYDYLVVAAGLQLEWNRIPGLVESLQSPSLRVTSNYSVDHVQNTYPYIRDAGDAVRSGSPGVALFTQPDTPIKCAGAPQKICYLAEETWRSMGLRNAAASLGMRVLFHSGMGKIFAVDKYARALETVCQERGIEVGLNKNLVEIRPETKEAVFLCSDATNSTHSEQVVRFDFLHVTPPMGPPSFLRSSGLTNPMGWVDVDAKSLQHARYRNVFALGDCSSLPTSKTAAAAAVQSGVLVENLQMQRDADTQTAQAPGTAVVTSMKEYDGYTSCPLVTGRGKLIMAEFSGYTQQPKETFWFDQQRESSLMYGINANVLPFIYWEGMMKGSWTGPERVRPLLNPFHRN